jgi:hypothetical protein
MTSSELAKEVFSIVEAKIRANPSPSEFELAYQARLAIDKIRFAVKQIEQANSNAAPLCEASLQLLDALDRLEAAERNFQRRFRPSLSAVHESQVQPVNGCRDQRNGKGVV